MAVTCFGFLSCPHLWHESILHKFRHRRAHSGARCPSALRDGCASGGSQPCTGLHPAHEELVCMSCSHRSCVAEPCWRRTLQRAQRRGPTAPSRRPSTCARSSTGRASTTRWAAWCQADDYSRELLNSTELLKSSMHIAELLLLTVCTLHAGNCGAVGCTHAGPRLSTALGPG